MRYEEIKTALEDKVNEIFLDYQEKLGITSGDVSPEMEFTLNHDISVLATAINLAIEAQEIGNGIRQHKHYMCRDCINAIKSHGERIFTAEPDYMELDSETVICEFCEEETDDFMEVI